jgi:hypothetical protein
MIQINSPISGTVSFVIRVIGVFAHYLNGYLLAMGDYLQNVQVKVKK